jgi:hypothetical protein
MSVSPVTWLPGTLTGTLPFFSVQNGVLYFRADDPNLYGISFNGGLLHPPKVNIRGSVKVGNKGRNFYSAPWSIPTLPCRDTGKREEVTSVDNSIFQYIKAFYTQLTNSLIDLDDFRLETPGYARKYQVVNGNLYTIVNGALYFGGTSTQANSIGGVDSLSALQAPLLSGTDLPNNEVIYDGDSIRVYQLPYNTFYAIDSPVIISAVDRNNDDTRIFLTLQNNVTVYNQFQTS